MLYSVWIGIQGQRTEGPAWSTGLWQLPIAILCKKRAVVVAQLAEWSLLTPTVPQFESNHWQKNLQNMYFLSTVEQSKIKKWGGQKWPILKNNNEPTIHVRLVLRCRSEARQRFAKLRSDVLVKLELLDNKHVQDIVFQLKRLMAGMSKFHQVPNLITRRFYKWSTNYNSLVWMLPFSN